MRPLLPCLFFIAASAAAQPVVEVSTVRDPELQSYATMVKGLDAFDAQHAHAPHAALRFLLRPVTREDTLADVELKLAGDLVTLPIAVDTDGGFVLPRSAAALQDHAELVLNKKRNSFRWRPDVRTPGVPANARRLGDLRVQCAVQWAIESENLTPVARAALMTDGGPCGSRFAHTSFEAAAPLQAVWLHEGERREPVPVHRHYRNVYTPPLADRAWSDDALVEFSY